MFIRDSIVPMVANETHEPQLSWSFTDVVKSPPLFRQSMAAGAANAPANLDATADCIDSTALTACSVFASSSFVTLRPRDCVCSSAGSAEKDVSSATQSCPFLEI